MDLNTIETLRRARTREDLLLAPGETFLAGGTWLFSEPQVQRTGLVDLSTMGWKSIEHTPEGLRIGATCTIAELSRISPRAGWAAHPIFFQAAGALLASFKIWNVATVGGNICRSYAAAAMVSLGAALDATALIWTADGGEYVLPVAEISTGNGTNVLAEGDVLRCVDIPAHALRARTGFRKIALAELGRSAAVLTGRLDESGAAVFTVTASTLRPRVLRYDALPTSARLREDVRAADDYYTDPLGTADWRRAVSAVLCEEIRQELLLWT
ncbi:CO or xanthine dehydrogenase, FAD-binding subunit [Saccharopolyspora shandongensis]|uniref:CO or xanthine dehydrogenase, FAD-binding subunit n=1 Tax=Saccharopolyspora shandongensis TaxID=418495 RepID=A0A1H3E3C6_9PSEU|nr:FAD binding domain-containing protein [Saccharopolyspora shandongensis]SDX73175.1 CO or xanthine dehydrogenase, FAD-binding subunit [Saccharopolyspora shandongensis]